MNDIDRSVDTMDFAFRRRFTFVEVKASDTQETILSSLDAETRKKAIARMDALNNAITEIEGLSSAYHIGGAYFLKLKELDGDFDKLWEALKDDTWRTCRTGNYPNFSDSSKRGYKNISKKQLESK